MTGGPSSDIVTTFALFFILRLPEGFILIFVFFSYFTMVEIGNAHSGVIGAYLVIVSELSLTSWDILGCLGSLIRKVQLKRDFLFPKAENWFLV